MATFKGTYLLTTNDVARAAQSCETIEDAAELMAQIATADEGIDPKGWILSCAEQLLPSRDYDTVERLFNSAPSV